MDCLPKQTFEFNTLGQRCLFYIFFLAFSLLIPCNYAQAEGSTQQALKFFENNIRPLLLKRCEKCHGAQKSESGLQVNSLEAMLRGGDSGTAIILGKPDESLIIKAIRHEDGYEMPPDQKLDVRQIELFARWIKEGAVWPEGMTLGKSGHKVRGGEITESEKEFWSLQPIQNPSPPQGKEDTWSLNDLDRFVFAQLKAAKLEPRKKADKRTLLRRSTFDLTGLPPTRQELLDFIADDSTNAFSKVIDRLLASSAYGERWGRHWLDVVRYADTAGETADYPVPLAWKYRNWVINAFNVDKPYDQFIQEQIAGDILAKQTPDITPKQYREMLIATGFIAISRRFGFDSENYHNLTIQNTIDTLGQSVLGLTLGCARCHDHKFDPVNKQDYYALYGIFESTRYSFPGSEEKKRPYDLVPALMPPFAQKSKKIYDSNREAIEVEIKKEQTVRESEQKKTPRDELLLAEIEKRLNQLSQQRDTLSDAHYCEMIYGVTEQDQPKNSRIQIRGELLKPGEEVPRRNLEILGGELVPTDSGSGRLELAYWLTASDNPLTARVMVNRIWKYHFGTGLVKTENDFGTRGESPTHPELLDWLASQFHKNGWSIKSMHRLVMNSATYQQAGGYEKRSTEIDPETRLLWRFPRRRLSAEEIRDAMLFISGDLESGMETAHPFPDVGTWNFTQHTPFYALYPTNHRSVYLMQQRLKRHPFLALFDGADPNASTPHRLLTSVPTQALYLMNAPFVHEQSESFSRNLLSSEVDELRRLQIAFQSTLSRKPTETEIEESKEFLHLYRTQLQQTNVEPDKVEQAVLAGYLRTLIVRNEFLFID